MEYFIDLFLHLDRHLAEFVVNYGVLVYGILFLIIFAETGLVVTPFLPGDSLLFATGALAASGALNIWVVVALLLVAAVLGDAVNYSVGRYIGPKVFSAHDGQTFWHRLLNRDHLDKAHAFFEKYGGKAVVIGRFVPIVRTFVPFVAGAAFMTYPTFAFYNVDRRPSSGWASASAAGWLFGNVPIVKNNFSLVALGIVFVSVLPAVVEYLRSRRGTLAAESDAA